MDNWTIPELRKWLKTFGNPNDLKSQFLGGASQETVDKARAILKEKQRSKNYD
mgnify:FL=1